MIAGKAGATGQCPTDPPLINVYPQNADPNQVCPQRCKDSCENSMYPNCACGSWSVVTKDKYCPTSSPAPLVSGSLGLMREECMRKAKADCSPMGCEVTNYDILDGQCVYSCKQKLNYCKIACAGKPIQDQPLGREYGSANEPATTVAPQVTTQVRSSAQGISAQYQRGIQPEQVSTTRRPRPPTSQW